MMITEKNTFLGVRLAARSETMSTPVYCWLTTKHHGSREAGATPIFTALIGHATPAFRQWPGASSWAAEGRGHGRW